MQVGTSGVRRLTGVPGIPDGMLLGATVDVERDFPGQLKNIPLCRLTAAEALADSRIDFDASRSRPVRLLDRRPHGRRRFRHRAARLARPDSARQAALVRAVAAEHVVCRRGPGARSPRPAAQQFDRLCERHDRHLEGRSRDPRRAVRPGAGRQLRSDPPAVRRRVLQHGRAGRSRRSQRRPADRSTPIAMAS